jgi:hypothetical protein
MLKKVPVLVVALALLLAASQLALAQQATDTTQQPQQQAPSPDQPTGEAQPSQPGSNSFAQLNENNELVVDCQALTDGLAQLQQAGSSQTTDPQAQSLIAQAESLLQLCEASGFTPGGGGGTVPVASEDAGGSTPPPPQG